MSNMKAVTFTVESVDAFMQSMKAAFRSKKQEEPYISFESFDLLWKVLAPNRMAIVQMMAGAGPMTLRGARGALRRADPVELGRSRQVRRRAH